MAPNCTDFDIFVSRKEALKVSVNIYVLVQCSYNGQIVFSIYYVMICYSLAKNKNLVVFVEQICQEQLAEDGIIVRVTLQVMISFVYHICNLMMANTKEGDLLQRRYT